MDEAWLDDFLAAEGLPEAFRATLDLTCAPLAELAAQAHTAKGATAIVALCGAQGSGKSTVAAATARMLEARGLATAVLSLDDLYLPHAARERLAREVHPLLITRGPPGTHDVELGLQTLNALARERRIALPRFDKAADNPAPPLARPAFQGPADVILFEGWCVGARAQPREALRAPVNALEAREDADGRWRRFVNTALATAYPSLFDRHDVLALLAAPSFEVVAGWRAEQEAKLRARTGGGMDEAQIARFVAHYERLTRWILDEMPARADRVFALDAERKPLLNLSRR
ncbi:kinase [Phenylobacterium sp.]|uniref:kinase n=1 Tax=Phenylobacterium sp. TaxID=1871053 RepID=UPI002DE9E685|nr:kinase [Phenylobacterium sp.]